MTVKIIIITVEEKVWWSGLTHCDNLNEAHFGEGTKLTVLEHNITTPDVRILPPAKGECRNDREKTGEKTLTCVASSFYPDHVSVFWQVNGVNVTDGVATDRDATSVGRFYRISSRLRVSAAEWSDPDAEFNCTVSFFNGTGTTLHVDGITGDAGDGMTRGKYLMITGNAKLSYVVLVVKSCAYGAFILFLVWKLQSSAGKKQQK